MRQAGVLAAGALYALAHHRSRLAEDHANALSLAKGLASAPGFTVDLDAVETNLVKLTVHGSADAVVREASTRGVLLTATTQTELRAVTHLDVSSENVSAAIRILIEAVAFATRP